jgi:hypothetical protein
MSINQIVRVFSAFGFYGSVISLAGNIVRWLIPNEFVARSLPNTIGLSLMLIGLIATYLFLARELGRFGMICFICAFLGFVWTTCMVWGFTFFTPALHDLDATFTQDKKITDMQTTLAIGLIMAIVLHGVSIVLYGISIFISSAANRKASFLLIAGGIAGLIVFKNIHVAGPVIESLGILMICLRSYLDIPMPKNNSMEASQKNS